MAIELKLLADDFLTAAQLAPGDMAELAQRGIRSVVNNRPDYEAGPQQPTDAAMSTAAQAAGLSYAFLPVVSNAITEQDVTRFSELIDTLPRPIVAYCRSGTRSGKLYAAAQARTSRHAG
jgi:uncharacterized protein (TIGR01244 family)